MKTRAIIQARMGSSRLRGKSLMPVAGVPLLTRVINTVRGLTFLDEILIATTKLPEDEPIVSVAMVANVKIYRGSTLDVLERFHDASLDLAEGDCILRITADNPFSDYRITSKVFELHKEEGNDYTHIDGLSHIVAEFIRVGALREAFANPRLDNFDREHVSPFFRKHRELFKIRTLPSDYEGLRHDLDKYLTIDNSEDLYRAEEIISDLQLNDPGSTDFGSVYHWLEKNLKGGRNNVEADRKHVINLNGTPIGDNFPTYVVAEIGQNHNGEIRIAKRLIDMAARCGANAVKFQKRDIGSELTREAFERPYDNPNSFGATYGEHRAFLELNEEQHLELKEYAMAVGITYFCTPCDVPSVEIMERIGCPFYKVASRDLTNIPLLQRLSKTDKPIILSTGMADMNDIADALQALRATPQNVIIMQCTSEYPCKVENVNLAVMNTLRKHFGFIVGLSDHTSGVIVSAGASILGAAIIEKHITIDRTMKGTDQSGSLEEAGLRKLIDYIKALRLAYGDGEKFVNPATKVAKEKLARSLTSAVHIPKGTKVTEEMLCLKSPGTGLSWKERNLLIGKLALKDIPHDVTLAITDFS